jgi:DNA-binding beta-propeller fold protein YncE
MIKKNTTYAILLSLFIALIGAFVIYYFFKMSWDPLNQNNDMEKGIPTYTRDITGDFDNPLSRPMDVVKVEERIYVTDNNNARVQVFDEKGESLFQFGKNGTKEGEFLSPFGITSDGSNIYVADIQTGKISIFDQSGKFKKYFTEKNEEEVLLSPIGIRYMDKKLYVTDARANKVFLFNLDGEKLLEISEGNGIPLFAPNCVAKDDEDNIYVSDSGNNRVLKFDKKGNYVLTINGSPGGTGPSKLVNPRGIGVSKAGILYFAENQGNAIYGYSLKGKNLFTFGQHGSEEAEFILPNGLYISEEGHIFITETGNNRVDWYN